MSLHRLHDISFTFDDGVKKHAYIGQNIPIEPLETKFKINTTSQTMYNRLYRILNNMLTYGDLNDVEKKKLSLYIDNIEREKNQLINYFRNELFYISKYISPLNSDIEEYMHQSVLVIKYIIQENIKMETDEIMSIYDILRYRLNYLSSDLDKIRNLTKAFTTMSVMGDKPMNINLEENIASKEVSIGDKIIDFLHRLPPSAYTTMGVGMGIIGGLGLFSGILGGIIYGLKQKSNEKYNHKQ